MSWRRRGPVRLLEAGIEMLLQTTVEILATQNDEDGLTDYTDCWVFGVYPRILLISGGASYEERESRNVRIRTSISQRTVMDADQVGFELTGVDHPPSNLSFFSVLEFLRF